jgi:hypothetical protein
MGVIFRFKGLGGLPARKELLRLCDWDHAGSVKVFGMDRANGADRKCQWPVADVVTDASTGSLPAGFHSPLLAP